MDGVFIGNISHRWEGKEPSAIAKTAVVGKQTLSHTGLVTDEQADLVAHGGADKALHHYPADHYAAWQDEAMIPVGTVPAAFGENISTLGLTEQNVHIGDSFRLGSAVVQISQGRQPCWKLSTHTEQPTMAYRFHKTGRTGWYYRVLQEGTFEQGDNLELLERDAAKVSVFDATRARLDKRAHPDLLSRLVALESLTEEWRAYFAAMQNG